MKYIVWDAFRNSDTKFCGGLEWIVDGEKGRESFPGDWPREKAVKYYQNGWSPNYKEELI